MNPVTDPASLPLRDIHLPDTVSWWPPAPGWWLLFLLLVGIIFLVIYWFKYHRNKPASLSVMVQLELARIRSEFQQHKDKSLLARDLSELLRRTCISLFPRQDTAALTGKNWLQFLDQQCEHISFSEGIGQILIDAPYQASPSYDDEALLTLIEEWLNKVINNNQGRKK